MSRSIVDTERIAAAAGQIRSTAETIESAVAHLRSLLGSLDGAWEGPAKAEFERVVHDYQGAQAQMTQSLSDIAAVTSAVSAAYAQHEDQTRALFAR
ncbi:MAG TPA: WXG100 family type VII secretion target [Intrasporangium sp.]|uniref:WXG100 family type VII secretion target n=1 Tax=Intrasporangium sp. TaxID=1925024 RepID=UPI002D78FDB9|nr:WXG100 family type VII secretion target [Intrasporangium sp.]HET7399523.1 WXG100 family type VII secretion target [Intrasporangium sp.]